jgi:hypothetical protein
MDTRKIVVLSVLTASAGAVAVGALSLSMKSREASAERLAVAERTRAMREPTQAARTPPRLASGDSGSRVEADRPEPAPEEAAARPERGRRGDRGEREDGERAERRRPGLGGAPMSPEDWAGRWEQMQERRREFMARFDTDGDGVISESERAAIREAMMERRREDMLRRMTPRFDADGDGVLNDEERKAAEEALETMRIEREARFMARFDTDGDGVLSDSERQSMQTSFERGPREGGNRGPGGEWGGPPAGGDWFGQGGVQTRVAPEMLERYDLDGDGLLNMDESYEAYLDQFESREQRMFLRRYDTTGDGQVGPADLESFLVRFRENDMHTDVNGDGVLDQRDVERFRDLMLKP